MLREQEFPLPNAVIERALQQGDVANFARIMERALLRVLDGTPTERKQMMFSAVPLTTEDAPVSFPLIIPSDLFRRFEEFCHQKSLNAAVLIAGALISEMGMPAEVSHDSSGGCPS